MCKAIHFGPVKLSEAPDQVHSSILAAGIFHGIQQAIRATTRCLRAYSGQGDIEISGLVVTNGGSLEKARIVPTVPAVSQQRTTLSI
jgi:hypothetical protein